MLTQLKMAVAGPDMCSPSYPIAS